MPTISATPISLKARPFQSVNLCFEVGGIIGEQNLDLAQRGVRVTAFDLKTFYANLLAPKGDPTRPGLLNFDSATIYSSLTSGPEGGPLLFALRAENVKALVDKAIATRENSYYKKFVNQAAVINIIQKFYTPTAATPAAPLASKPDHLETLAIISQSQHDALKTAYADPSMSGVVKVTTSDMIEFPNGITYTGNLTAGSSTVSNLSSMVYLTVGTVVSCAGVPAGTTITAVHYDAKTIVLSQSATATAANVTLSLSNKVNTNTTTFNDIPPNTQTSHSTGTTTPTSGSTPGTNSTSKTFSDVPQTQTSHTNSVVDPVIQHTANKGYTFRVPTAENDAQNERAQASLLDERFKQFMYSQHLPFLPVIFNNNLATIDLDVKRLQVGYVNSILVSPVSGLVTQIYRHVGDCVQAGQPIVRIDQDDVIIIVGTIKCRNALAPGNKIQITTNLYDASPAAAVVASGTIVVARGSAQEDERWEVVAECTNPVNAAGNPSIPLNYSFDYDNTTISVTT